MIKVIGQFSHATGRFGVTNSDFARTHEIVFESATLEEIKTRVDKEVSNWKVLRYLFTVHPDNDEFRKQVTYADLFAKLIESERVFSWTKPAIKRWGEAADRVGLNYHAQGNENDLKMVYKINKHVLIVPVTLDYLYDTPDVLVLAHTYDFRQRLLDKIDGKDTE